MCLSALKWLLSFGTGATLIRLAGGFSEAVVDASAIDHALDSEEFVDLFWRLVWQAMRRPAHLGLHKQQCRGSRPATCRPWDKIRAVRRSQNGGERAAPI